jgi:hypothetical protein
MSAAMSEVAGAELDTVEGGLDWGCVALATGVGGLLGALAGPVGAAAGMVVGFAVGLQLCD